MALRTCLVSVTDLRKIRHSVEVQAESLYEAAVLGLQILHEADWVDPIGPGTPITVEVREAATQHDVTLSKLRQWLEVAGSPKDVAQKTRLRALVNGKGPLAPPPGGRQFQDE